MHHEDLDARIAPWDPHLGALRIARGGDEQGGQERERHPRIIREVELTAVLLRKSGGKDSAPTNGWRCDGRLKERSARGLLLLAAVATLIAWQLPYGRQILYPFTLLATYAHEMGHGLTAILVGGSFRALEMNWDGSGLAHWQGNVGRIGRALVAAGGLVGPSIAGAALLSSSRRPQRAPVLLVGLAVAMGISAVIWARSLVAGVFIIGTAAVFVLVARFGSQTFASFFVQLVGVQLCVSVFRDIRYMFSNKVVIDGVERLSDSAAIAEALWLPYWVWGAIVAAVAFAVLCLGLFMALRRLPQPS